ncbi:hypothetical protein FQN53_003260 [Emmonsiellopsis sp. PD_33]|nr:hypothetical protein FQN53_003260 [Emmonsiellopsis sp. PD_33]
MAVNRDTQPRDLSTINGLLRLDLYSTDLERATQLDALNQKSAGIGNGMQDFYTNLCNDAVRMYTIVQNMEHEIKSLEELEHSDVHIKEALDRANANGINLG